MSRVRTGWRLAKDSWAVLRSDRSLALFPALSTAFATGVLALTLTPGLIWSETADKDWIVLPFMLVGGYAVTFVVVYFNVALAAAARQSMDGRDTKMSDGLSVARERRGLIAQWALLQFTLGVLTRVVQRLMGDGAAASLVAFLLGLVGVAWSIASFFAVPLLALEGLGPRAALERSASLVRERWGEGLVGQSAIGMAVFLVAFLPLAVLLNAAVGLIDINPTAGAVVGVIAIIAFIGTATMASGLSVIFRVGLYRYSTEEKAAAGFAQQDMVAAFQAPSGQAA
jgi:hypothetical protein